MSTEIRDAENFNKYHNAYNSILKTGAEILSIQTSDYKTREI
jgi:hypothetical protein